VGNAAGDPIDSWLNPTSGLVGLLAVATSSRLAAVLKADGARVCADDLVEAFRSGALTVGSVAGAVALGGLLVLHSDPERIYDGLEACSFINALLELGPGTPRGAPACGISRTSARSSEASPTKPASATPSPSLTPGTSS
jgi:hypothetical protein